MPVKILRIDDYTPRASDVFFFDNNIWMHLFCPLINYRKDKQRRYSKFFDYLLSRKSHIYLSALVLSEFANRYLRLEHDVLCKRDSDTAYRLRDFKRDFVGSPEYKKTASEIKIILGKMSSLCIKVPDDFHAIDCNKIFTNFEMIGFNDSYYIELASNRNWIIVTDDSDFVKKTLPPNNAIILTALN